MKSTKKLSSVALLSVLALTGCTNSNDSVKNETSSAATGTRDVALSVTETTTGTENSGTTISASFDKDKVSNEGSETNEKDSGKTPTSEKQTIAKKQDTNKEEDSHDDDNDDDDDDDKTKYTTSAPVITNVVTTPTANTSTSTAGTSSQVTKTAQISYKTPAGDDIMRVSVSTTKDGIITKASATPLATNPISLKLQQGFADKISAEVVGKSIKGLKVDTVSGASLTTAAFNGFLANNSN